MSAVCQELPNGTREWRRDGVLHRDDGPAVEHPNGAYRWFRNGLLHRNGGPAVRNWDGMEEWYCNGSRHRSDGPAILYPADQYYGWWIHDHNISVEVETWLDEAGLPPPDQWTDGERSAFRLRFAA